MDFSLFANIGFFIVVFLVNFFGAISGGAGLIVRPLLILLGVPPQFAIGSTRTGNVFTRLVGLSQFHKYSTIDWRLAFVLTIPATIASIIGVQVIVFLDTELLTRLIGFMIILSGIGLVIKRDIGLVDHEHTPSFRSKIMGAILYGISTFIASLTGGGGIINNYVLIFIYKKSYITAAAIRKVAGFVGAVIGSLLFIYYGLVDWKYVAIIVVAGSIGTYLGVQHGIRRGEEWVRWLVLLVVFVFGIKMLFF